MSVSVTVSRIVSASRTASAAAPIGEIGFQVSGRAFLENPELAGQMPGTFLGRTLQDGIEMLNRMLHELNPLLR